MLHYKRLFIFLHLWDWQPVILYCRGILWTAIDISKPPSSALCVGTQALKITWQWFWDSKCHFGHRMPCPFILISSVFKKKFWTADFNSPVMPVFLPESYNTKCVCAHQLANSYPFSFLLLGSLWPLRQLETFFTSLAPSLVLFWVSWFFCYLLYHCSSCLV